MSDTLKEMEPHPAIEIAKEYIRKRGWNALDVEAISSCALSGNRLAEVCMGTIRRLENKETVSDRYFMGLAWLLWKLDQEDCPPKKKEQRHGDCCKN